MEIQLNPVINGTFTYNAPPGLSIEVAIGTTANTIATPGIVLTTGMFHAGSNTHIDAFQFGTFPFGIGIDGTRLEVIMVVQPFSSNASIAGTATWNEPF